MGQRKRQQNGRMNHRAAEAAPNCLPQGLLVGHTLPQHRYSARRATVIAALVTAGLQGLATAPSAAQITTRCEAYGLPSNANPAAEDSASGPANLRDDKTPRQRLADMVRSALDRSQALGAAALLAEAASLDEQEARTARLPQAQFSGGLGPSVTAASGSTQATWAQAQASVQLSQVLWDAGRSERLVDWKKWLAESSKQARLNAQEQLAANTVSLALERSRYRQHVLIYGQYTRKMACLVQSLQDIVAADRGRASELVQARKSLQQAELSRTGAQTQLRQVEIRLRRLVGDGLPSADGLSSSLLSVPSLDELRVMLADSPEIAALTAQTNAADQLAKSVQASMKPQVSWSLSASTTLGAGGSLPPRTGGLSAGVSVSIPLTLDGARHASDAAQRRAQASRLQREDALTARQTRLDETHDQASAALERAGQVGQVLATSEQLRDFTLQQWQQLGRRSLFDVISTEAEHYNLRVQYVNALHDGQQLNALLLSLGRGVGQWVK